MAKYSTNDDKNNQELGEHGQREHDVEEAEDIVTYTGKDNQTKMVGKIKTMRGMRVFDWHQRELEFASKDDNRAFSLSKGLKQKLEKMDVEYLYIRKLEKIVEIGEYSTVIPTNDPRFEEERYEPQYVYYESEFWSFY